MPSSILFAAQTFVQFSIVVIGRCLLIVASVGSGSFAATASPASAAADHVTVELVSETSTVRAGTRAWLGLKFTHEPHWHTYWMNPGDSGLPTRLEWQLPKGYRAGDIVWPAPKRFDLGDLFNFGYDDTVLLMVPIEIPTDAAGVPALGVTARWLICNDVCIPGKATLSLNLPIAKQATANATIATLFAKSRASVPIKVAARGAVTEANEHIRVDLDDKLPKDGMFDFFPTSAKLFTNAPFKVSRTGGQVTLSGIRSEYFEAAPTTLSIVVTRRVARSDPPSAWQFEIPWSSAPRASALK
jgi:DsbC/DsbD-like thiol-disulfide interchange protein